ncbi:replicative DNA helicase [Devosia sp. Root635]|uniref:replicative DNA helicase n=1 Tax=Devosia sp. Root635 TaxID=1736575 RepID=UPI0006F6FA78|nr:replicative DNA helicase [Devosia sp. Root635]KRA45883.1 replicative DNA helicase [Devosia sp. Root635]
MAEIARLHPAEDKSFRLAPHNVEAEQALLGAILLNNDAFYRVSDFLEPLHFYEPVHRDIYEVAGKIIRAGKSADPTTIKTHLPEQLLPDVTMAQYLAKLAAEATTVLNAADYGQAIYDTAIRRNLILVGEEMVSVAYDGSDVEMTPNKQIEKVEGELFQLAEKGRYDGGFQNFSSALSASIQMAGEAYQRDGGLSGIATGLDDLDRQMGGLQKSDLIILAGRPAMGKSSLATNIAFNIAKAWKGEVTPDGHTKTVNGGVAAFFSLEMSAEQLATRMLAEQAEISSSDIRRGRIHDSQFSKLVDVSNMMSQLPLYIDDTGGLSVAQVAARARRLKRQKGIDFIVIDYLQLLSGSTKASSQNRVQELTEITTTLKALAKELEVPIMALSQLSRQVEARDDKHPQLADLRESGSIEQDADVVLFVYREEYYLKNKEPKEGTPEHMTWQGDMEKVHGKAEVIIGKQRHGPTGTVQLSFEAQFTRFGNLARADYLPERME